MVRKYVQVNFGLIVWLLFSFSATVNAQDVVPDDTTSSDVKDLGDMVRQVLNKKPDSTKAKSSKGIAVLPSLGYNPSFGFVIGGKASAIRQFGKKEDTDLSAFGLEALYTSKGIITAQARHNVFTPGNKLNFQGNWQLSKFLITDYSIGTGNKDYLTNSDSAFLTKFTFIRLTERVYRRIGRYLYVGGGLSFNIRNKINDEKLDSLGSTPHNRYSLRNDFDPLRYSANGLLLAMEYNSKEHPLRAYKGIYAEFGFLFNQKWLGSTKSSAQVMTEVADVAESWVAHLRGRAS